VARPAYCILRWIKPRLAPCVAAFFAHGADDAGAVDDTLADDLFTGNRMGLGLLVAHRLVGRAAAEHTVQREGLEAGGGVVGGGGVGIDARLVGQGRCGEGHEANSRVKS